MQVLLFTYDYILKDKYKQKVHFTCSILIKKVTELLFLYLY